MSDSKAEIFITKLVAAKRQLRAAIRLFFGREDELAVHTVAAAAYNLLRELKKTRGKDETEDIAKIFLLGLVSEARNLLAGNISEWAGKDEYLVSFLKNLAEHIPPDKTIDLSDIRVSMGASVRKIFCDNRVANFLKHADRDVGSAISTKDVNNLQLLGAATWCYESIAPDDLGYEGLIFEIYLLASLDIEVDVMYPLHDQVRELRAMSPAERINFCDHQIRRPRPEGID